MPAQIFFNPRPRPPRPRPRPRPHSLHVPISFNPGVGSGRIPLEIGLEVFHVTRHHGGPLNRYIRDQFSPFIGSMGINLNCQQK